MFQLLFAVSPAALECPFSVANRALSASNTLQMPRTMRPPDFLPLLTRKGKNMAGEREIKGEKKRVGEGPWCGGALLLEHSRDYGILSFR